MKLSNTLTTLLLIVFSSTAAQAQDLSAEIIELRNLITDMQQNHEQRISDLETRLSRAERSADSAQRDADEAIELAEQTAIDLSSGASSPNTFNPAIGVILIGQYADVGAGWDQIPGFQPAGEVGNGATGFSLGESEVNLNANIDSRYYGNLTLGLHDDDGSAELEIEEAWIQTTDLPSGLTVLGGRFFSATGYLNNFHSHTDDFVDRPLPYQAFFGGRYSVDGLRASWIAPTPLLIELGAEANWGDSFPTTQNGTRSPGAWTLFAKIGGDIGDSQSWQVGVSALNADVVDRDNGVEGYS